MSIPSIRRFASMAVASALLATPAVALGEAPLDSYLPKSGKIEGHVMRLGVAPEDQAIDRQFRAAVQNNMDWFQKFVRGNKAGQPLPYDRRMGITEAQYHELQHMKADFQPGAPVEISVRKGADGSIAFNSSNEAASALKGVTFPPDGKAAETPFGKLAIVSEIHQKNGNAPIGVWNGVEWAKVEPMDAEQPSSKIAFGKREPSGEGVMYYQIAPYKDQKEQSLVVFYKLD